MKIQGLITAVFRDINTGEITKEISVENAIPLNKLEEISNITDTAIDQILFGPNIFVSSDTNVTEFREDTLYIYNCEEIGTVPGGATSPEGFLATDTTFSYVQFFQRFSPPASDRTINIIGLTHTITADADFSTYGRCAAHAYVVLTTPCIQLVTETLDVFYRVQFPYDYYEFQASPADPNTTTMNPSKTDTLMKRHGLSSNNNDYFTQLAMFWQNLDVSAPHYMLSSQYTTADTENGRIVGGAGTIYSKVADAEVLKGEVNTNITINDGVGLVIGTLGYGAGASTQGPTGGTLDNEALGNPFGRPAKLPTDTPIQNAFGHNTSSTGPFYNAGTLNSGDGLITFNGDSWTNPDFPKLYRIDIQDSGGTGVGTYTFKVRNFLGFFNNTYKEQARVLPLLTESNSFLYGLSVGPNENTDGTGDFAHIMKYLSPKHFMLFRGDAISLVETKTTLPVNNFNSTDTPSFGATAISQIAVDEATGDIWVACRNTGLYKIENPLSTSPTITQYNATITGSPGLSSDNCYGVDIGNGRIYTIFNGGLFYTTDGGTSWNEETFTNTTITSDWTLVRFLKADPNHADHRLGICYDNETASWLQLQILWWDTAGSSAGTTGPVVTSLGQRSTGFAQLGYVTAYQAQPWSYFQIFDVDDVNGDWGCGGYQASATNTSNRYPAWFTYGSATVTYTPSTDNETHGWLQAKFDYDSDGTTILLFKPSTGTYDGLAMCYFRSGQTTNLQQDMVSTAGELGNTWIDSGHSWYLGDLLFIMTESRDVNYKSFSMLCAGQYDDPDGGNLGHILWKSYSWEGSPPQWVEHTSGSPATQLPKTIHAAAEELSDGVTIAFDTSGSPPKTFTATDYYTVTVVDGITLDGASQIDHKTGIYYGAITENNTALESGTLSSSQRSPEIFKDTVPTDFTWQDVGASTGANTSNVRLTANVTGGGARSVNPINGNVGIDTPSENDDLHGSFRFQLYSTGGFDSNGEMCVGLSDSSVLGTGLSVNSPQFGFYFDGSAYPTDSRAAVQIYESGVSKHTVGFVDTDIVYTSLYFEIVVKKDGTVEYWTDGTSYNLSSPHNPAAGDTTEINGDRILHYTSTLNALGGSPVVGGSPLPELYVDIALNNESNAGINNFNFKERVPNDYYHMFGTSAGSTGRFVTDFFAIDDSQNITILIDGTAATPITRGDYTTSLSAGQVAIFPREGFIRYSASDATKTITADYSIVTKQ